jgi:glutathione synthase/RimK-type ligase-like ATP-grasp enzyme
MAYVLYHNQGSYHPDLEAENNGLLDFLRGQGLHVQPEIWDDPDVHWAGYDLVILKAPWDYFDKIDRFYAWLATLERLGVRLLNPGPRVRWNADKHYLADIAATGLPVTPGVFLERGAPADLTRYFEHFDTGRLIVKPCVSGGSKNTFAFGPAEAPAVAEKLRALLPQQAFLVQPFIPQIEDEGEWSLLFFNGRFSHALLKKPVGRRLPRAAALRRHHPRGYAPADLLAQATKYVTRFAPAASTPASTA